ncbi:MAG TPA: hypothetical protein PLG34_06495 [Spirochaetota bacterium]|jgi:arsenate reductase-like glutaredoxin family protein|nr:MAG: hypothetical protein BWX91_00589 [Spirochaetes bacterium ADurb.Bin133]HNZ26301.1 hypothetical protein [Spirochaetota bacterium]HPY87612.1 hypothetical protein [Spirochaetota bacterium]HQB62165.1 hypothetical protein [Spirochaetota bacterium]
MNAVKEKMIKIIKDQPDDSTFTDIIQELSFARMINNGLKDSDSNKVTEHNALKEEIKNW